MYPPVGQPPSGARRLEYLFSAPRRTLLHEHWQGAYPPFGDLDPFNQMLAINETAANLDRLAARDELHAFWEGGLRRYQLSGKAFTDERAPGPETAGDD